MEQVLDQEEVPARAEKANWKVKGFVEKFTDLDENGRPRKGAVPDEVVEFEENVLCNAGIQRMLDLLIAAGGQAYDNTHTLLGVGDTTGSPAAGDTDMFAATGATHRQWEVMNATYPSRSSQTLTFQATFASGEANFHWQEWMLAGGTAAGTGAATAPALNHRAVDLGTKTNSSAWTLNVTITIS